MTRYSVELARHDDDAALRALLARNSMGGAVELAFLREPSYFLASPVQAPRHQVIVARDGASVVGAGFRGIRPTFLNGIARDAGYLGDLRLDASHRGGSLVARGYRLLRELHADRAASLYLTLIADGNDAALQTIAAGRAGLPSYRPLGRIFTPAVKLPRVVPSEAERSRGIPSALAIVRGTDVDLDDLVACLQRNLARRQFAPFVDAGALRDSERMRGLTLDDFAVAVRNGKVIGAVAAWDQSAFRQTLVVRYRGAIRAARPLYNLMAPLLGNARYPAPGQTLRYFYASLIAVDDDDRDVFRALLARLAADRSGGRYHYFVIALHERDPLLPVIEALPATRFAARAFAVHFDDGRRDFEQLDGRVPYVEPAML